MFNRAVPFSSFGPFGLGDPLFNAVDRDMSQALTDPFNKDPFFTQALPTALSPRSMNFGDDWRGCRCDTDFIESDNCYHLKCDLPGLSKDDIKITLRDNRLVINANKPKSDIVEASDNVICRERYSGPIRRSVPVPIDGSETAIKSWYTDGVLHIDIPKVHGKRDLVRNITVR